MTNTFVFDIETVPDVVSARRLQDFEGLNDADVAERLFEQRREATGSDFLRHHMHRIVAISVVLSTPERFHCWSLGDVDSSEPELLQRFFKGIEQFSPTLVSWNGSGFDLPVIHYRSLLHGVSAPQYWDQGEHDSRFRYNNYLNRFHLRHTDLMDLLSLYQARAYAPLDEIAAMLGFPGKMGMSGAKVWDAILQDDCQSVRDYCETDVLNTYLVYCRFRLIRGDWDQVGYEREISRVQHWLEQQEATHFQAFLAAWRDKTVDPESEKDEERTLETHV